MQKIRILSKTVTGKNKKENQDYLFYHQNQYKQIILAIADGVGIYQNSKIASGIVCQIVQKNFMITDFSLLNQEEIKNWMQKLIEKKIVPELSKEYNKIATTLTLMLLINENFFIIHIGDTRICYIDEKKEKILQITQDHNFSSSIDNTFSWIKGKKFLQNCISNQSACYIDITKHGLKSGYYLISSDGLHDFVDKKTLYKTLTKNDLTEKDKIKTIFDKALFSGSLDDMSCILLKVI